MRFFFEREEEKVAVPADSPIAAEELGDIRAYDEAAKTRPFRPSDRTI